MLEKKKDKSEKKWLFDISSATLHILAMIFMLLDHTWATVLSYNWMACVGRIAFPIFAFLIVEGFTHTRNLKRYMLRMLIFAVISEIPFNLMYGGQPIYPVHQNVLWTFLLAMSGLWLMEKIREKHKVWLTIVTATGVSVLGLALGYLLFVDFYGCGILTVFIFYFFDRSRKNNFIVSLCKNSKFAGSSVGMICTKYQKPIWTIFCMAGQFLCLYYINVEILGGLYYNVKFLGIEFELVQQSLALLALIPIWLYHGRQGYHAKWFQYFNYAFYPAHCLVLGLIAMM